MPRRRVAERQIREVRPCPIRREEVFVLAWTVASGLGQPRPLSIAEKDGCLFWDSGPTGLESYSTQGNWYAATSVDIEGNGCGGPANWYLEFNAPGA